MILIIKAWFSMHLHRFSGMLDMMFLKYKYTLSIHYSNNEVLGEFF